MLYTIPAAPDQTGSPRTVAPQRNELSVITGRLMRRGILVLLAMVTGGIIGCTSPEPPPQANRKLQVSATLFPLYDMARAIGGEHADTTLLLPPGMEAHGFEPRPGDIIKLNKGDLFIYTGRYMEPWAESLVKGLTTKRLRVIDASAGIQLLKEDEQSDHRDHDHHDTSNGMDPHIWLDPTNAQVMTATILAGFVAADPGNAAAYRRNAAAYQARLVDVDRRYRTELGSCRSRTIVHGGHFAFGYLAKRYGLDYISAFPASGEAEPNARRMADMVELLRKTGARYMFMEKLASPRLADTLAREAGVGVLTLRAAHNVSKEELATGTTFPDIMASNLDNLRKGLSCR